MRVLQLGSVPPPHGGIVANVAAIRERLKRRGDHCRVIAITKSSEILPDADVQHPGSAVELVKFLLAAEADIVHLHLGGNFSLRLAGLALLCGWLPNRKKVLTFHSGGFASTPLGKTANPRDLRAFAVRRFDKIVAVNSEIADLFKRYGVAEEKIETIAPHVLRQPDPNVEIPLDIKSFYDRHNPVLLSVGLLETDYDLPLQIRVLELIKKDYPNAGLIIVGAGSKESELRQIAARTSYAEHIRLTGDVPHQAVLHLIERADVLLRTTLFDGDAISIREALFLNTPVVASDNKMRPKNVKLFKIGDCESLRAAIVEALSQPESASPKNQDGWENIDAVLQIYGELLKLTTAEIQPSEP